MSGNPNLTPDSAVLQQLDGQWQKIATILLYKLKGREQIRLTAEDFQKVSTDFAGLPVLYTHGHSDGISLQVVDLASAERLAAHEQTMRGTA